jgi:hypothetical protein
VIGFSQVLANKTYGDVNERQMEYLTSIVVGGRHLRRLVDDLQDLARGDVGHLTLDMARVTVADEIPEVVGVVHSLAQQKDITVTVEVKEPLPAITADRMRVKQMIYNLLSKAIKFTDQGGHVTVTADTLLPGDPGGASWLRIRVADTGIGILPDDKTRIFDKFERGDRVLSRASRRYGARPRADAQAVQSPRGQVTSQRSQGQGSLSPCCCPEVPSEPPPTADALRQGASRSMKARPAGQALVHPVHVGAVEACHVVRGRQRLGVKELGQLVVLRREAGRRLNSYSIRSAAFPRGSKKSLVRLVPWAALMALAMNSVFGFVTLMPKMQSPSESFAATRAWCARLCSLIAASSISRVLSRGRLPAV